VAVFAIGLPEIFAVLVLLALVVLVVWLLARRPGR
jgi:hypothetical protein